MRGYAWQHSRGSMLLSEVIPNSAKFPYLEPFAQRNVQRGGSRCAPLNVCTHLSQRKYLRYASTICPGARRPKCERNFLFRNPSYARAYTLQRMRGSYARPCVSKGPHAHAWQHSLGSMLLSEVIPNSYKQCEVSIFWNLSHSAWLSSENKSRCVMLGMRHGRVIGLVTKMPWLAQYQAGEGISVKVHIAITRIR